MQRIAAILLSFILVMTANSALANDLEEALQQAFDAGDLKGLHSVLVRQNGETLAEIYFNGEDQRWGAPIGVRAHGPDTLHDMRSVSKSIVGLLYGIALSDGLVPAPDAPVLAQFPEYDDLASPGRDSITVGNTLSMQMGIRWNETLPYTNPRNSEIAMERAPDRYRYVLERPLKGKPGRDWVYNGGATAILAGIISRGAGMPIDAYARKHLFAPLGISRFEWVKGGDGVPAAASGLRLSTRDLAKIGEMVAAGGVYGGRQIVPASWLQTIFTPRAKAGDLRYGYQWWLAPHGSPPTWVAALGNGGQRLSVNPGLGLVIAINAGNYNQPDDWKTPVSVIVDYVVPALGLD